MEATTEALAERTPEEAVLMQDDMNLKEEGINPLLLLLFPLAWFFIVNEGLSDRPPVSHREFRHRRRESRTVSDRI